MSDVKTAILSTSMIGLVRVMSRFCEGMIGIRQYKVSFPPVIGYGEGMIAML